MYVLHCLPLVIHASICPPCRTPPEQSSIYDMERGQEDEPPMAIVIPSGVDGKFTCQTVQMLEMKLQIAAKTHWFISLVSAQMNVNTNATTRGDAQVSRYLFLSDVQSFIIYSH